VTSVPRIAHVISEVGRHGGAAAIVHALSRAADERGWEQVVLNPFAADGRGLADYFEGVPYEALPPHRTSALPRNRRWLRSRFREFGPDIVHVHLVHAMFAVASLQPPEDTVRVLTHHHSRYLIRHRRPVAARLERLAGRRFDCVVAPSESVLRFLVDEYRFPRVTCIPNGWSGTPLLGAPKDDRPTVVCTAHFRPVKRHRLLLEAFCEVREALPDARLALLGEGPLQRELRELAAALGIDDAVEFPGSVDVWPWLAGAHAFALASEYEGSPVAVLEAMAAGLPVVAFDVPGTRDVVRAGITGYLAGGDDSAELAQHLIALLPDAGLRERMGDAARRDAEGMTMAQTTVRYFELYERLISGKAGIRSGAASEA
jgi:glycosyltransferase involved in cell wall biosynthesis